MIEMLKFKEPMWEQMLIEQDFIVAC